MFQKKAIVKPGTKPKPSAATEAAKALEIQSVIGTAFQLDRIESTLRSNGMDMNRTINQLKEE
jgi:hypothetical protein